MDQIITLAPDRIFDGTNSRHGVLRMRGAVVEGIADAPRPGDRVVDAAGLMLVPGFVDLQVNGGGGTLFNNDPTPEGLGRICAAHAAGGTTALLATLITDRPEVTQAAIEAVRSADQPGLLGLHLEGPHIAPARKGTHDPALIRPMLPDDLVLLCEAAAQIGVLMVTLAPESVTEAQVRDLVAAGIRVSLGHTDCTAAVAARNFNAGVRHVTHLFNAMSQFGSREPGLVGAALGDGRVWTGLIADGFHVDPLAIEIALRAKAGPGRIFLVSDAMSTIGTDATGFTLNGRQVFRRDGRLTLQDGTLAGADIDMIGAVRFVHHTLGVPLEDALRMASAHPAAALGLEARKGGLLPGMDADVVLLSETLHVEQTWIGGRCVFEKAAR